MGERWTMSVLEERLAEAVVTLQRMPADRVAALNHVRACWPDAPAEWDGYGWESAEVGRVHATSWQITRMDEVIGWLAGYMDPRRCGAMGLPPDTGKILWLRAARWPWPRIAEMRKRRWGEDDRRGGKSSIPGGNSPPSLRKAYGQGLRYLVGCLNQAGVPVSRG